jgi:23S rRNA pseudouridine2605 synthase
MSAKQSSGRLPGEKRPRIPDQAKRAQIESSKRQQSEQGRRAPRNDEGRPTSGSRKNSDDKGSFSVKKASGNWSERPSSKPFSAAGKTTRKSWTKGEGNSSNFSSPRPYSKFKKTEGNRPYQSDSPYRKPHTSAGRSDDTSALPRKYSKFSKPEGDLPYRTESDERRLFSSSSKPRSASGGRTSGSSFTKDRGFGGARSRPSKDKPMTEGVERKDKSGVIRLNKYLADAGICSRREADNYIQAGVVKVNDIVVTELGSRVNINDKVEFEGQVIRREKLRYVLLNKPKGYITTSNDPYERKTVMELVAGACDERIYPVGRLDRNTTGLLLLTNDGDLAKILTHPSHGASKLYHVWLDKPLTKADLRTIAEGVTLEDGLVQVDAIDYVAEDDSHKQVGIQLHSGRNRVVRRLFEHLGYEVVKLDRVMFAGLTKLKLTRGHWRFLTPAEISMLKRLR